ncbi:hypothetical protein HanIR_Chr01g0015151 [Helianthus annuus]|nr:hypothetical protein HanIR_Chr01g0015151 [Helianthus annuus]
MPRRICGCLYRERYKEREVGLYREKQRDGCCPTLANGSGCEWRRQTYIMRCFMFSVSRFEPFGRDDDLSLDLDDKYYDDEVELI